MPCLLPKQFGLLPTAELDAKKSHPEKHSESEPSRLASFATSESWNANLTVSISPFVSDKLSLKGSNNQKSSSIEITTVEKVRLRRVVNSFTV